MNKPVEVNLAGESSEVSEEASIIKNMYLNISTDTPQKRSRHNVSRTRTTVTKYVANTSTTRKPYKTPNKHSFNNTNSANTKVVKSISKHQFRLF